MRTKKNWFPAVHMGGSHVDSRPSYLQVPPLQVGDSQHCVIHIHAMQVNLRQITDHEASHAINQLF